MCIYNRDILSLFQNAALYYKDQEEEVSSSEVDEASPEPSNQPPMQPVQPQLHGPVSHLHRTAGIRTRNSTFPRMGLYATSEEQLGSHYGPAMRNSLARRVRPEVGIVT
jgi:hypothetical protein